MRNLLAVSVLLLAAGLVAAWLAGSFLIRSVPRGVALPPGLGAQELTLDGADGRLVAASWLPGAGRGGILLLHGIGADRRQMADRARFLHARGYAVLMIDLPGQGASPADAVTFGLHEGRGVRTALAWLRARLPGQRVGVIGVSLGGASTVLCADCPAVDAVVLESMYPTIEEAVQDRLTMRLGVLGIPLSRLLLWQLPLRLGISTRQLRPVDHVAALRAPVLIAAGSADRHTTLAETRRLYAAAAMPKELWIVEGAGHVDLHAYGPAAYEARVGAFLDRYVGARP